LLKEAGRLCVCVVHPLRDSGRFASDDPESDFVIADSYFESRTYEETFERDGLRMTFSSWRYPLERYTRAIEDAGMLIEVLREPLPDPTSIDARDSLRRSERLPMFLFLRAVKP
jgi:hypothetical protein